MKPSIDFDRLRAVAVNNAENLIRGLLPDGKPSGREWIALDPTRGDHSPGSFSQNMDTGLWGEFATGAKGGILELYAYVRGVSIVDAAHAVARDLGLSPADYLKRSSGGNRALSSSAKFPPAQVPRKKATFSWVPICPVPHDAPPPLVAHYKRGKAAASWIYRDQAGALLGVVDRFNTSDGGKEILPQTYGTHEKFGTGWQYRQWAEPRPLYGLWHLKNADIPVLVLEGEKCVEVSAALLRDVFEVVTWPGGGHAVGKADWTPLAGRRVVLWPDCDAQQNKERTALLPRAQQPGEMAMQAIAARLVALGCHVTILNVGEPGSRPPGYDVADAINQDGWDAADLVRFIADASTPYVQSEPSTPSEPMSSPAQSLPVLSAKSREVQSPAPDPSGAPQPNAQSDREDFPFTTDETGTYYHGGFSKNKPLPPFKISGPIWVLSHTRDENGAAWTIHVRCIDKAGTPRLFSIPMAMMSGDSIEMRKYLMDGGFQIGATGEQKSLLSRFLQEHPVDELGLGVSRVGWYRSRYVMVNETIGIGDQKILFQSQGRAVQSGFGRRGTAQEWIDHVGKYCVGNSRTLLAVSVAFAAVLLKHSGEGNAMFAIVGLNSGGKTTSQFVACSVNGPPEDFMQTWNGTSTGFEGVASQHNDSMLSLNDMGEADPRTLGAVIYMFGNGGGKQRGDRTAAPRMRSLFRLLVLSSSEVTAQTHMASVGQKIQGGQEVRLLEVPSDGGAGFGVFENLHGDPTGAEFAARLERGCHQFYGEVGYQFIHWAVSEAETLPGRVRSFIDKIVSEWLPVTASAHAKRAARKFALVAAGGEMASHIGLTSWPAGEATRGVHRCFQDWLDARGGDGNGEARRIMRQVQLWIGANVSRFQGWHNVDDSRVKTINRAGWRRLVDAHEEPIKNADLGGTEGFIGRAEREQSTSEYLVMAEVFRSEVCAGLEFKAVLRELDKRGHLRRFSPDALGYRARPPGESHVQVYVIRASVLGDADV